VTDAHQERRWFLSGIYRFRIDAPTRRRPQGKDAVFAAFKADGIEIGNDCHQGCVIYLRARDAKIAFLRRCAANKRRFANGSSRHKNPRECPRAPVRHMPSVSHRVWLAGRRFCSGAAARPGWRPRKAVTLIKLRISHRTAGLTEWVRRLWRGRLEPDSSPSSATNFPTDRCHVLDRRRKRDPSEQRRHRAAIAKNPEASGSYPTREPSCR
jgi:hypothetical protein